MRIFLIGLALSGCSREYNLSTDPDSAAAPDILVDPHSLAFYEVNAGETEVGSFTVSNVGSAALEVQDVVLGGASAFTVLTPMPRLLDPDESLDVEIAYSPLNAQDEGYAIVVSTDPDTPEETVELLGTWAVPALQIDPADYDFGDVVIGCTDSVELTLTNLGTGLLTIDEILHTGEGFELAVAPEVPLALEPAESTSVLVEFSPETDIAFDGTLWVTSNDPAGTRQATQIGSGDADGVCVTLDEGETVTVPLELEVQYKIADVAFLIDTTGSMGSMANAVANEFASISSTLQDRIPDITFGVGTFEDYNYGNMGYNQDRPFTLHQQQTSDFGLVQGALSGSVTIHDGADAPESSMEALYQAATGHGYDQDCDGGFDNNTDVPPFVASAADAFGGSAADVCDPSTPDGGEIGGFGFREDVLPIIVFATDTSLRDPDAGFETPGGCPQDAGSTAVLQAMNAIGARVIAVGVSLHESSEPYAQMVALAEGTGSYGDMDGDGSSEPAVITWSGTSAQFRTAVVDAIEGLTGDAHFDLVWLEVDGDDHGMVKAITPEFYEDVDAGTAVDFEVELYGTVAPGPSDETLALNFKLLGQIEDSTVTLDSQTVYVMVPSD